MFSLITLLTTCAAVFGFARHIRFTPDPEEVEVECLPLGGAVIIPDEFLDHVHEAEAS